MKDFITKEGIEKYALDNYNITIVEETKSTNTDLKLMAQKGAKEKEVLIALKQSGGRGRMERNFFSPASGIYMSMVLKPDMNPKKSLLITTAAASATALALDEILNIKTQIKWVNDIYYNNKKVCGILTESAINSKGKMDFAILGIGINVYSPKKGFPVDLAHKAGFLSEEEMPDLRNKIVAKVLDNFWSFYKNLENKDFYNTYKEKNMLKGKTVEIPNKGFGEVLDIDRDFCLVVEKEDKTVQSLMTGEVIINL